MTYLALRTPNFGLILIGRHKKKDEVRLKTMAVSARLMSMLSYCG